MTVEELRQYIRETGRWTLELRARRKSGKRYAYARRKESGKVVTRYICPEDEIGSLDQEAVEKRLQSDAR